MERGQEACHEERELLAAGGDRCAVGDLRVVAAATLTRTVKLVARSSSIPRRRWSGQIEPREKSRPVKGLVTPRAHVEIGDSGGRRFLPEIALDPTPQELSTTGLSAEACTRRRAAQRQELHSDGLSVSGDLDARRRRAGHGAEQAQDNELTANGSLVTDLGRNYDQPRRTNGAQPGGEPRSAVPLTPTSRAPSSPRWPT
jgi:hypothetical protein